MAEAVKEYFLFVDTETSGIPRDWGKPYSTPNNWPHIAQLAWVIYTRDGQEIKAENHYVQPSDYDIEPASGHVHGLTTPFLREHGQPRHEVMQRLHADLELYQPLVVAHFMQLDYHMMGVGFYRAGLDNPLLDLPTFCTMVTTERFMQPAQQRFLRLGELYQRLFREPLLNPHDALVDAYATARCFFALREQGTITDQTVAEQAKLRYELGAPPARRARTIPWALVALLTLVLAALAAYFILS